MPDDDNANTTPDEPTPPVPDPTPPAPDPAIHVDESAGSDEDAMAAVMARIKELGDTMANISSKMAALDMTVRTAGSTPPPPEPPKPITINDLFE